jgi:energy-coupling factor transporter transmembrane protein EcfT
MILSIIIFIILYYKNKSKKKPGRELYNYFFVIMGILFMPIHFINENVIKLISMIHLNNHKILCLDESKITEVGNIDTVIFSKSGNKNKYKIISFCPVYFKPGTKKILIKEYEQNEEQNITNILDIHMNYFKKVAMDIENKNDRNSIINTLNKLNDDLKNEELMLSF